MDELPLLISPLYSEESCWEIRLRVKALYSTSFGNDVIFNNTPILVIS
jgi:hypothetical protein|tara:strand:+ start:1128 stop:1271 length:144 start_codon:yes stop_codon:yes gene_type:complete